MHTYLGDEVGENDLHARDGLSTKHQILSGARQVAEHHGVARKHIVCGFLHQKVRSQGQHVVLHQLLKTLKTKEANKKRDRGIKQTVRCSFTT